MTGPVTIDLQYLETISGGDPEVLREMVEALRQELPLHRAALAQMMEAAEAESVFQASHHLKSTLAYTGCRNAIDLNLALETAARAGGMPAELKALWEQLDPVLSAVITALENR